MIAYYNEFDPKAAEWLCELIKDGQIAPGEVDTRSILDVTPNDLRGFSQCHFFAGVGVWSYALRIAGWPDDRPVWTGSCPCQPFSSAGKGLGIDDERHLWPAWYWLIGECSKAWQKPVHIFGEQVASQDGLAWLDIVQTDLEAAGYAVAPLDFCSASVGAPHIRQRIYFVADAECVGRRGRRVGCDASDQGKASAEDQITGSVDAVRLADIKGGRLLRDENTAEPSRVTGPSLDSGISGVAQSERRAAGSVGSCGMGNADIAGSQRRSSRSVEGAGQFAAGSSGDIGDIRGPVNGFWRGADWVYCRDERWRPFEPTAFPLAHGSPGRVGLLRGAGNAINAQQAAIFIKSYLDI